MSRLRPALAALTHLGITTTAGGLALATPVVIMGAAAFHNSVLKHLGLGTSVGNVVLAGSCLTLAAIAPACLDTAETHARRLKGTPAARFLRRAIPGAVVSASLLFNAAAPGIGATINPFRPKSLQDYMVQAYHLYNQCSPNTPSILKPGKWRNRCWPASRWRLCGRIARRLQGLRKHRFCRLALALWHLPHSRPFCRAAGEKTWPPRLTAGASAEVLCKQDFPPILFFNIQGEPMKVD